MNRTGSREVSPEAYEEVSERYRRVYFQAQDRTSGAVRREPLEPAARPVERPRKARAGSGAGHGPAAGSGRVQCLLARHRGSLQGEIFALRGERDRGTPVLGGGTPARAPHREPGRGRVGVLVGDRRIVPDRPPGRRLEVPDHRLGYARVAGGAVHRRDGGARTPVEAPPRAYPS